MAAQSLTAVLTALAQVGNSWRTGIDVFAAWDDAQARQLKLPSFLQPVLSAIKQVEEHHPYAGPGEMR